MLWATIVVHYVVDHSLSITSLPSWLLYLLRVVPQVSRPLISCS